jgi:hypothetical protein
MSGHDHHPDYRCGECQDTDVPLYHAARVHGRSVQAVHACLHLIDQWYGPKVSLAYKTSDVPVARVASGAWIAGGCPQEGALATGTVKAQVTASGDLRERSRVSAGHSVTPGNAQRSKGSPAARVSTALTQP